MSLLVNQLIKWNDNPDDLKDDRIERIIFIDETSTDIATVNVSKKKNSKPIYSMPVWYKYKDIEAALVSAEACILQIDHLAPQSLTTSDLKSPQYKKIKSVRDMRFEIIGPLVIGENAVKLLFPHERAALIAQRTEVKFPHGKGGKEITYSRKSIYKFIHLWWRGGQVQNALLGGYINCGAVGKNRKQTETKLGRPIWKLHQEVDRRRM